jgi:hypothetical protein
VESIFLKSNRAEIAGARAAAAEIKPRAVEESRFRLSVLIATTLDPSNPLLSARDTVVRYPRLAKRTAASHAPVRSSAMRKHSIQRYLVAIISAFPGRHLARFTMALKMKPAETYSGSLRGDSAISRQARRRQRGSL